MYRSLAQNRLRHVFQFFLFWRRCRRRFSGCLFSWKCRTKCWFAGFDCWNVFEVLSEALSGVLRGFWNAFLSVGIQLDHYVSLYCHIMFVFECNMTREGRTTRHHARRYTTRKTQDTRQKEPKEDTTRYDTTRRPETRRSETTRDTCRVLL